MDGWMGGWVGGVRNFLTKNKKKFFWSKNVPHNSKRVYRDTFLKKKIFFFFPHFLRRIRPKAESLGFVLVKFTKKFGTNFSAEGRNSCREATATERSDVRLPTQTNIFQVPTESDYFW